MHRAIPTAGVVVSLWSLTTYLRAGAHSAALSAVLLLALFALLIAFPSWKVMPTPVRLVAFALLVGAAAVSLAPAWLA